MPLRHQSRRNGCQPVGARRRWRCWPRCFHDVPSSLAGRFPRRFWASRPGMAAANVVEGLSQARRLVRRAGPKSGRRGDSFGVGLVGGRIPARWLTHSGIFILTQGKSGAVMRYGGRWFNIPAYPAQETDPTGPGDVFAAAFLIRYFETKDAFAAGLFASCAASLNVEGIGAAAIPTRAQIQRRLSRYPTLKVKPTARGRLRLINPRSTSQESSTTMFNKVNSRVSFPDMEREVLQYGRSIIF